MWASKPASSRQKKRRRQSKMKTALNPLMMPRHSDFSRQAMDLGHPLPHPPLIHPSSTPFFSPSSTQTCPTSLLFSARAIQELFSFCCSVDDCAAEEPRTAKRFKQRPCYRRQIYILSHSRNQAPHPPPALPQTLGSQRWNLGGRLPGVRFLMFSVNSAQGLCEV